MLRHRSPRPGTAAFLLTAVLLAAAGPARRAEAAPEVKPLRRRPIFHSYSYDAGMPHAHVRAIAQDGVGLMWFGTEKGLARFDGERIRTIRGDGSPTSAPRGSISALVADQAGRVWIGTSGEGLFVYDPATSSFRQVAAEQRITAEVTELAFSHGALWVAVSDGRLFRIDQEMEVRPLTVKMGPDHFVTALAPLPSGDVWAGTTEGRMVLLAAATGDQVRELETPEGGDAAEAAIRDLLVASDGNIWIASGSGALRLAPDGTGTRFVEGSSGPTALVDQRTTALLEDAEGGIWIGTEGGLGRLRRGASQFDWFETDYTNSAALPYPYVTVGMRDRGGVLWFGTFSGGATSFDPLRDQFRTDLDGIYTATFVSPDRMWAGSLPGVISLVDFKAGRRTNFGSFVDQEGQSIELTRLWVTAIHAVRGGAELWLGIRDLGLVRFDPATGTGNVFRPTEELPGLNDVFAIVEDRGALWLASWGGGLLRLDLTTLRIEAFGAEGPTAHLYTAALDRTDPDLLWLGTADAGLYRFRMGQRTMESVLRPENVGSRRVVRIEQEAGALWLATYGGGLIRFEPGSGKRQDYDIRRGLPSDDVVCVMADRQGRMWASTEGGGLAVLDPRTGTTSSFDNADGIPQEFAQNSCARNSEGKLVFSGTHGMVFFDPATIRRDAYAPAIVKAELEAVGSDRTFALPPWRTSTIEARYDGSPLALRFVVPSYGWPQRNRYSYRIDEDTGWIEAPRGEALLSLPPGDYDVELRAQNRHGLAAGPVQHLALHVLPPWWRTWWAYAGYAGVAVLVGLLFVRYQRDKVRSARQSARIDSIERNLELTAAVQAGFLPTAPDFRSPSVDILGYYKPAEQCSGDWWWYDETDRHLVTLVGDVTGHGPGPAMVTGAVATAFRVRTEPRAEQCFPTINREVLVVGQDKYQMTMTALEIDQDTGRFRVLSAGGLPVLVLSADNTFRYVLGRGTPLGTRQFDLGCADGALQPGDRCLLFTDGIIEIPVRGRAFGLRRLARLLDDTRHMSLDGVAHLLEETALSLQSKSAQEDDWTFVLLDWRGRAAGGRPRPGAEI